MKFSLIIAAVSLSAPLVHAVALPEAGVDVDVVPSAYSERSESKRDASADAFDDDINPDQLLFKRRGGGGRSGGGGGSSSSGRGGSSSGGSSRGGSSSSGSSGSGSSSGSSGSGSSSSSGKTNPKSSAGKGSSSSNAGGRTTTGSGIKPSYGGGKYYGGGAAVPYKSGTVSPLGIVPVAIGVGAVVGYTAAVSFWPGSWYHPIYYYPYYHPYNYYNRSSGQNETRNVACACDETVVCGCDDNSNSTEYMNDVVGNGSYSYFNPSNSSNLVSLGQVNGTQTLLINGTLANGTTAEGGTESASAAGDSMSVLLQRVGWWPIAVTILSMVYL